jgi:hypothetical protein
MISNITEKQQIYHQNEEDIDMSFPKIEKIPIKQLYRKLQVMFLTFQNIA